MKRMFLAVALSSLMAAMLSPGALAEPPVPDSNCTFENGKTTCTETVSVGNVFVRSEPEGYILVDCGYGDKLLPVHRNYYADVYETTTTVYKGKSDKVLSTETTQTQGETYAGEADWPAC
jgi:hypothetical protein